jgi:hypothetical protein
VKLLKILLERQITFCLVTCLVAPFCAAETNPGFHTAQTSGSTRASEKLSNGRETAGLGGIDRGVMSAAYPDTAAIGRSQSEDQSQQNPSPQTTPPLQNTTTPAPAGTAAAPYEKQEGVSASNPAGSAIAPGKQRRIRSYAIRVGLLIGAAVAIGVVAGASLGSSSRP